jgi:hypothetical protein
MTFGAGEAHGAWIIEALLEIEERWGTLLMTLVMHGRSRGLMVVFVAVRRAAAGRGVHLVMSVMVGDIGTLGCLLDMIGIVG